MGTGYTDSRVLPAHYDIVFGVLLKKDAVHSLKIPNLIFKGSKILMSFFNPTSMTISDFARDG